MAVLLAEAAPHLLTHLIMEDVTAPRPGALRRPALAPPDAPAPFDFAAVNAIRAQINDPDPAWWDGIEAFGVPTLIIGGAHSTIPQHLLAETVERMPDARLVTIDAGHNVHQDRPTEFVAAVNAFLTTRGLPGQADPTGTVPADAPISARASVRRRHRPVTQRAGRGLPHRRYAI